MSKIISTPEILERVKSAKAGDMSVYINYEAIKELPEEFDVQLSKVEFKIESDFSDVGNKTFMPTPALHYLIAEAKGISGIGVPQIVPIYENVNINEMYCLEEYKQINMLVGYRCTKQSTVLNEDGTSRLSSPCTIDYNVWNRCAEAWTKEEMYTDGYKKKGQYPNKYDSKYKRKSHFQSELKFAMQKAETKAFDKTIRELAGLMTGYTADELKEGSWYFAKIRRSADIMKLETAARLTAIEGGKGESTKATKQLFGPSKTELDISKKTLDMMDKSVENIKDVSPDHEPAKDISKEIITPVLEKTEPEKMADVLTFYLTDKESKKNIADSEQLQKLINWLKGKPDISKDSGLSFWKKAINKLKEIEKDIPEFIRGKHELY